MVLQKQASESSRYRLIHQRNAEYWLAIVGRKSTFAGGGTIQISRLFEKEAADTVFMPVVKGFRKRTQCSLPDTGFPICGQNSDRKGSMNHDHKEAEISGS